MKLAKGVSERATEACLAAIERLNGRLNAMISVDPEGALQQALAADKAGAEGRWLGLLHGVPITIKDNIDVAGMRTTCGSLFFKDRIASVDAPVVARLKRAGAVILGKATLHELAFGIRCSNSLIGPCRNPWNPARVPGGSSGGSAVAVAVGMCAVALGSDTGGSIRLPAAMCGVAGLRPTLGRVPGTGVTPVSLAHDTVGPMAASVAELALCLAVIAGGDRGDPVSVERPLPNFLPRLGDGVAGLRIGIPRNHYFAGCDAGVSRLVMEAATVLERLGAQLVDVSVPGAEEIQRQMTVVFFADACATNAERLDQGRHMFDGQTYDRMITGRRYSAVDYANGMTGKRIWKATLARLFQDIDILLSPAVPTPIPPVEDDRSLLEATRDATKNSYGGAFGEIPGLVLPCGFTADGLPTGVQLEAAWWREPLLLQAGHAFQSATDWHGCRAPVA